MAISFTKSNRVFRLTMTPPLKMGLHSLPAEYKLSMGGIYNSAGKMTSPPDAVMLDINDPADLRIDHPEVKSKIHLLLTKPKFGGSR